MSVDDQSPRGGLRQGQRRSSLFEDVVPYTLSDDYAAADLEATRAGATWGPPIDVRGRDEVSAFVSFTKVSGQTGLTIAVQDGASDSKAAVNWFDRHAGFSTETGDTATIPTAPRDQTLDVSGFADGAHRILVVFKVRANFMRFKPYGAGTVAASRCTLTGQRFSRSG